MPKSGFLPNRAGNKRSVKQTLLFSKSGAFFFLGKFRFSKVHFWRRGESREERRAGKRNRHGVWVRDWLIGVLLTWLDVRADVLPRGGSFGVLEDGWKLHRPLSHSPRALGSPLCHTLAIHLEGELPRHRRLVALLGRRALAWPRHGVPGRARSSRRRKQGQGTCVVALSGCERRVTGAGGERNSPGHIHLSGSAP